MFDLAAIAIFVLPEFRGHKGAPQVRFRLPSALEAVQYSTAASDFRLQRDIDIYKMSFHADFPMFAAERIAEFVVGVDNIGKSGSLVDWSDLNDEARVDLLLRLGTTPDDRLFTLIKLAQTVFVGLSAEEKKSLENMSEPDMDQSRQDASVHPVPETSTTESH